MDKNIRNFVIIAHIDHGKSTLADRFLEITGTVEKRLMKPQYLDQLELERERGITIKMAPVRMKYKDYELNLIDTPGHSDFSYEVSRALVAVEGAILLVDATQGIQAQTLANYDAAQKAGLVVIGAVNKIDVASEEQIAQSRKELVELLGIREQEITSVSGKTGIGVSELLEEVIQKVPPPKNDDISNKQALIFDSIYDDHKGVIAYVRIFSARGGSAFGGSGGFRAGASIKLGGSAIEFKIKEIGYFAPALKPCLELYAGEIGYIATGVKDPGKIKIGDTIGEPSLPGYREPQPVVFVSFYPEDPNGYDSLRQALARLRLNDAALKFESDMSEILGRGFKGGFLGRLHFEITAERLAREFQINTVHSFPSVAYQIKIKNDGWITITNPRDFPQDVGEVLEPMTKVEILTPAKYLGPILELKELFRFSEIEIKASGAKTLIKAKLPLSDLISDLDDKLKSVSEGFASLSYEQIGWERGDVDKLEIFVASQIVPGLTRIVPKKFIEHEARATVLKLKELLPRGQFAQALQASIHGRIIARETIPALRKDVTGYLYGGDRTRKMKLWKKQQKGKKKLKEIGSSSPVKIPAEIFKELLKRS